MQAQGQAWRAEHRQGWLEKVVRPGEGSRMCSHHLAAWSHAPVRSWQCSEKEDNQAADVATLATEHQEGTAGVEGRV